MTARPPLEVADIFRQYGADFRSRYPLLPEQRRVMQAIEVCRTAVLGGHLEQCDSCCYQRIAYNSCRNRHCPKCQSAAGSTPVSLTCYQCPTSMSCTLPEQLAMVALQNKRVVYNLLFASAAKNSTPSPPILNTSGQRLAFWRCCTPGVKRCVIIRICIVWYRVAGFHLTANAGSVVALISSCR